MKNITVSKKLKIQQSKLYLLKKLKYKINFLLKLQTLAYRLTYQNIVIHR